jgi:hypothetical protein
MLVAMATGHIAIHETLNGSTADRVGWVSDLQYARKIVED